MDLEFDLKMLNLLSSSVSACLIAHYDNLKN